MLQIENTNPLRFGPLEIGNRRLIAGTRGSALARWQTEFVITSLKRLAPALKIDTRVIRTEGDRDRTRPLSEFGALGVFTKELEHALLNGSIDFAVHSLKDLPTESHASLQVAAFLPRQDAREAVVSRHNLGLMQLPRGARIGTSSARRTAQILALRPDAKIVPLRGNVDTRLRKAHSQEYDAIVIAAAGLIRLGLAHEITEYLSLDTFLPDPGQGALAVQIRAEDDALALLLAQVDHAPTRAAVTAERAFLRALGGGCRTPIAAYGEPDDDALYLRGMVGALDGTQMVSGEIRGDVTGPEQLGSALAEQLRQAGAAKILSGEAPANRVGPLHNKRIVVTRAREQADELAGKIRARGGEPVEFPAIAFAPLENYAALDAALAHAGEFDWVVFTSANGVRAVAGRMQALHLSNAIFENTRIAAIGPGTARALEQIGVRVRFIPAKFLGEQVARELPVERGQRALLLRADIASDVLAEVLATRGVQVSDIDAYRTVLPAGRKIDLERTDAVTFTSSSTVRNFLALLDAEARGMLRTRDIFCIGPVTEETAREFDLNVSATADEHTLDGLVEAMVKFYGGN